jgi:hypothetical protein
VRPFPPLTHTGNEKEEKMAAESLILRQGVASGVSVVGLKVGVVSSGNWKSPC